MNRHRNHLPAALTIVLLGSQLLAQIPDKPPPWWGVQDNVTVSLYWDFSGPAPLVPLQVAVPPWYTPAVTQGVITGPLVIIPTLNGHTDVLGLVGNGTAQSASLDLTVDNDPHLNWVKIFWFQFDEFQGASGAVIEAIEQDLLQYDRSSVTTTSVPIGQGWNRVTVSAQLIPQPDDEGIDWTFTENALGNAAIDNLFVNSKCVKIDDSDQDADGAMGEPDGFSVNLSAATGFSMCLAAATTEGPAPAFTRTYWISALSPAAAASHQVIQLNESGLQIGTTSLPDTLAIAPNGATDLAVERIVSSTGTITNQFVYALLDRRTTITGDIVLRAINTNGTLAGGRNVFLTAFPPGFPPAPHRFGLAFDPTGERGLGTFWLTDQLGSAWEFSRLGLPLDTMNNLPPGVVGAGYDDVLGNFYWFSNSPVGTPSGPVHVTGYEWSGYDLQPTGARFFGDLTLLNPGAFRGGLASGLEVYRRDNGDFRALCVVQLVNQSRLYELKGPFRWGASLAGTCGMQGLPFEGSNNFQVTLSGVPTAAFAALYAGFSPRTPAVNLAGFGLDETNVLVNFHMNSTLQLPTAPGEFAFTLPLLGPGSGFSYVPLFFQWVVFDPTAPHGVTMSKAGKTLIY